MVIACGYLDRSRYQNTSKYIIAQNLIKYTSFLYQTLHNETTSPHPWKIKVENMTFLGS